MTAHPEMNACIAHMHPIFPEAGALAGMKAT